MTLHNAIEERCLTARGRPSTQSKLRAQSSGNNNKRACYYCCKKGHIAKYCFKKKNNEKESANTTKVSGDGNEYAFIANNAVAIANVSEGHE